MPRRPRAATGGIVYHALNRAAGRRPLFRKDGDYLAFERVLAEACRRFPGVRLLAYCLMPTHWHLVLWPRRDGELSDFVRWLSVTHAQRDHAHRHTAGTGPLYQGRFKSFPVQRDDAHFLTVCRYVERNALRAGRVRRAEDWRWCSLARRAAGRAGDRRRAAGAAGVARAGASGSGGRPRARRAGTAGAAGADSGSAPAEIPLLAPSDWPVEPRADWARWVNSAETDAELQAIRRSVWRGAPYGGERWSRRTAESLGLLHTLRPRGRPPKRRPGPPAPPPRPRPWP